MRFRYKSTFETFDELYKFTGLSTSGEGIGEFQNCTLLKSVRLNKFLIENNAAFNGCSALESVIIEDVDYLESIYNSCFCGCVSLTSINVNFSKIKTYGANCFANCSSLEIDASLLDNVEYVGKDALHKVKLYGVLNIPKNTSGNIGMLGPNNLESIMDLGAITSINMNFVKNCPYLKVVHIPSTVTNIDRQSFRNGIALESFVCHATTPPTLGASVFFTAPNIYVPDASVEAYKTATNWSTYASQIKPLSEYVES